MTYTGLLWLDLAKNLDSSAGTEMPPVPLVLPIVIYNGSRAWNVSLSVEDMYKQVPSGLEPYLGGRRYILLDEKHSPEADHNNVFSFVVLLEKARTPDEIYNVMNDLLPLLAAPQYRELNRVFSVWIAQLIYIKAGKKGPVPELKDLLEVRRMLSDGTRTWKEEWQEEAEEKSKLKTLAANIKSLMKSLGLTREEALKALDVSAEEQAKLAAFEPGSGSLSDAPA